MEDTDRLFSGCIDFSHGFALSNGPALARVCPEEFKKSSNPWNYYVSLMCLLGFGDNIAGWKLKSRDETE